MNDILTDLSPTHLTTAIKANLYTFFRAFKQSPHADFFESDTQIRWQTSIPHPWFSAALSTQPPAEDVEEHINDTLAWFNTRGVRAFTWWPDTGTNHLEWEGALIPRGFTLDQNTPGMAVDFADLPASVPHPTNFTICPVEDEVALHTWTRIFMHGYGLPEAWTGDFFDLLNSLGMTLPFHHYLGYLDGNPVATSTRYLGAGVAGIYNVATLPEARGKGIGAAITLQPLLEGREMGYRAGILQSSDMGFRVYQRLGFKHLCQMEHFYKSLENDSEK
ncbi:MAG TPA: GNAT family N-acetyltransferase [Anaerolineales bacterium]|nr:GNAT family N-acetyltransferase [Anaerolineales bacterium]